jgi:hypothetical protein
MVCAGVGRGTERGRAAESEPCWRDAFRLITDDENTRPQMRQLDRHRDREINTLKRKLKRTDSQKVISKDETAANTKRSDYLGHPYSYYATLKNMRPKRPSYQFDKNVY